MRGYCCIGLHNPKNRFNVGATLRAAGAFDAQLVVTSGRRYHGSVTDVSKQHRHIPLVQVEDLHAVVPFDCVPVAVDLVPGATPLQDYIHPERAFYVFGAEDATLGTKVLSWCRDVVYIPTNGCLNLAACVNVVLYDRMQKRLHAAHPQFVVSTCPDTGRVFVCEEGVDNNLCEAFARNELEAPLSNATRIVAGLSRSSVRKRAPLSDQSKGV